MHSSSYDISSIGFYLNEANRIINKVTLTKTLKKVKKKKLFPIFYSNVLYVQMKKGKIFLVSFLVECDDYISHKEKKRKENDKV